MGCTSSKPLSLCTLRLGTLGRYGNSSRWSNPPVHIQWNPAMTKTPLFINSEKHLKAQQNYSKICRNEPRYNEWILTVPTQNLSRCNEYFARSLAAVSKNDRFESKFQLAFKIESVFDVLIFSPYT